MRRLALSILIVLVVATTAPACPTYAPDFPGVCACADAPQNWPAQVAVANLITTAEAFLGVTESCAPRRGQPFWQIQRYYETPALALLSAEILDAFGVGDLDEVQAWSTEFVVLLHELADVPDARAFASPHTITSRPDDPGLLLAHFGIETFITLGLNPFGVIFPYGDPSPEGRGIVVDGTNLDFANFDPGVTAPCPGAVQFTDTANTGFGGGWVGGGSVQLVTDMVIYNNADGDVVRFDVKVIQGDARTGESFPGEAGEPKAGVRSFWIQNAQDFTRPGGEDLYAIPDRRIRAWGINYLQGTPLCDLTRVAVVGGPPDGVVAYLPEGTDPQTQQLYDMLSDFSDARFEETSIFVSDPGTSGTDRMPDGNAPWLVPAGQYPGGLEITIDIGAPFPLPVEAIEVTFADGVLPPTFRVLISDGAAGEGTAEWPVLDADYEVVGEAPVSLRRPFDNGDVALRTLSLFLPETIPQALVISRIEPILGSSFVEITGGPDPTATAVPVRGTALAWLDPGTSLLRGRVEEALQAPSGADIEIGVFDARGRRVHDTHLVADDGGARFVWTGRDGAGVPVARGVYYLRAATPKDFATKKLIVLE